MDDDVRGAWSPFCSRPDDIVWPLKAGRAAGDLTWKVANGRRFERVAKGRYLPVARGDSVEQRIVAAAARLRDDGTHGWVTGWASLRWQGANYFDGFDEAGLHELPVEVVVPSYSKLVSTPAVRVLRRGIGPREYGVVAGLPVTTVPRALFDEIHRRNDLWAAVQAIDMTAAARLTSVWLFGCYLSLCNSRNGVPLAREAASLAVDESLSPREPWLRMVWKLLAGLPEPHVNEPVFDLHRRLIGVPDLFDARAGLAGEYGGMIHLDRAQRRKDNVRAEAFRDHGIEVVEVVGGESRHQAAARLVAGFARAAENRRSGPPRWTMDRPPGYPAPEMLDDYFERTGQVERLTSCGGSAVVRSLVDPESDDEGDQRPDFPGAG